MHIEKLNGTDERLYHLVAPLVMNPDVLKKNNNYPFKTTEHYVWYIALQENEVVGFIPVEMRAACAVINNYYIAGGEGVCEALLQTIVNDPDLTIPLQAVVLSGDLAVFQKYEFEVIRLWKLYVKMLRQVKTEH